MIEDGRPRIVIIGAGPGGLCMAIELLRAGYDDFVVLEQGDGVGGTWYHNRYPGCACDVPAHLYSYSFEVKADWSRPFATQPEIRAYFDEVVEKYGLGPYLRFGCGVRSAIWHEETACWRVQSEGGETFEADFVVSAIGMFNELNWPDIVGLDRFGGTLFHSARWNHDHDLGGEAVGVIGSAASAVQFVPQIAEQTGPLFLYQRTPNWVTPKEDEPFTAEQIDAFRNEPERVAEMRRLIWENVNAVITFSNPDLIRESVAAAHRNLALVEDPELRARLTPTEPFGCKRPLISNDYYPTFNRPNVELVTDAIAEVREGSIVTVDGQVREVDTIILATGFQAARYLSVLDVVGRDGQNINEAWKDGARAYLGMTTAGFPNLFMLYGPNTNNGSIIWMLEQQVAYVMRQVERVVDEKLAWIDVRTDMQDRYNRELQRDMSEVGPWQTHCNGYYRTPSGRIVTQWPHSMDEFQRRTRRLDPEAFDVGRAN